VAAPTNASWATVSSGLIDISVEGLLLGVGRRRKGAIEDHGIEKSSYDNGDSSYVLQHAVVEIN
jgi:hypothetical protein